MKLRLRIPRNWTEADIHRIVHEELNRAGQQIVRTHAGKRARLLSGVRPPTSSASDSKLGEAPPSQADA